MSINFKKYNAIISFAGVFVFVLGLLVALGWLFKIQLTNSLFPNFVNMKFNTALGFMAVGTSLYILSQFQGKKWLLLAKVLGGIVGIIGLLSLLEYVLGSNFGIDQLVVTDWRATTAHAPYPGRMSQITSICLIILGLFLATINNKNKTYRTVIQWLLHIVTLLSFYCLVGYFFNVSVFGTVSFHTNMSIHASLSFFMASVASALIYPSVGFSALFTNNGIGNVMARKMFLRITIAVLILGYIRMLTHQYLNINVEIGITLLSVSFIITALFLIKKVSNELNDIDRKKVEAENSFSKANTFLNSTPDPIVVVDDKGIIRLVNDLAEPAFGYSKQELVGQSIAILIPERFRGNHTEHLVAYFTAPNVRGIGSGIDLLALKKNGEEFPVEISLSPIKTQEGLFVSASIRDVTPRKQAEQALKRSNERNRIFVQQAPNAIAMFDVNMCYLAASQQWMEDYDLVGRNIIGHSHYEIFPEIGDEWKQIHQECLNGAINKTDEAIFKRADGSTQWIAWDVRPWYVAEGKIGGLLMYTADITEKKLAEDKLRNYSILESKSKEMEQFAYIASHDLREPLLTMKNYISILLKQEAGRLDSDGQRFLESIARASDRMDALIKGLLDYSRLSQIKQLQQVDCNEVVNEVLADLELLIKTTGTTIVTSPLPTLNAYPLELKLLFQNLINNAIKFSKKDVAPVVEISAQKTLSGWQFEVLDNGIGIDEKSHEKIFAMFQRLHRQDEYEGTGLGLAQCKKITELHNGHIWVESVPGQYSKFCFTIAA